MKSTTGGALARAFVFSNDIERAHRVSQRWYFLMMLNAPIGSAVVFFNEAERAYPGCIF